MEAVPTYAHDADGRQTRVEDANTNGTDYEYTAAGRLSKTTDAEGGCTEYM